MKKIILMSLLLLILPFVSAQTYDCPMSGYGGMMYGAYGSSAMIFGWIIGLLVTVALVLFIVWLVKQIQKKK